MKSYDSGGPMVSGHTTPQGGGCDKPVPSEVPPASQPGDPMENWLMGPSLEWLEQAEHGADQQRCKMIADLLRDLWRGPSSGTTSAVMETGTTAVLATQDGLTPLGQRIAALEAYEIILNQIAEVVGIETPYGALPDAVKDLAQRAEADADQAKAPEFVPVDFRDWLVSLPPEDTKAIFARVWDLYDGPSAP